MKKRDIDAFIEEMESIGDIWTKEEVERVYGDSPLDEAVNSRKAALGLFFNILDSVINGEEE